MSENGCLCVKCVGLCVKCHSKGVKHGKTKQGKQRYFCKICIKTFVVYYSYHAYNQDINTKIISFTKENVGILGTARLLKISAQTVIKRIKSIASKISAVLQLSRMLC
jgi:insertion element IS1 protein InsB